MPDLEALKALGRLSSIEEILPLSKDFAPQIMDRPVT